jgi:hypothetical protein
VLSVLGVVGLFQQGFRRDRVGIVAMFAAGAVCSVGLLFIHFEEVNVTDSGFRQDRYLVNEDDTLRLYNTATTPVTICTGTRSTCVNEGSGPTELRAPGLTLRPGETVKVAFARPGDVAITIANPGPKTTAPDAVVHVNEDPGPIPYIGPFGMFMSPAGGR